jgi:hypothetical protein
MNNLLTETKPLAAAFLSKVKDTAEMTDEQRIRAFVSVTLAENEAAKIRASLRENLIETVRKTGKHYKLANGELAEGVEVRLEDCRVTFRAVIAAPTLSAAERFLALKGVPRDAYIDRVTVVNETLSITKLEALVETGVLSAADFAAFNKLGKEKVTLTGEAL